MTNLAASASRVAAARRGITLAVAAALCASCAGRRVELPTGSGEPFAEYGQAFAAASAGCRDVRSLTAEAAVSGVVGRGKVRGRVIAGFERPGRMRLEAVAPIGPPVFILAADGGPATLLMPRASQVLPDTPPESVLETLVGVSLRPDDLLALLAGCVKPDPVPTSGRRFPDGWVRVDLEGGSAAYLRLDGGEWRIAAGMCPLFSVRYEDWTGGRRGPRAVGVNAASNGGPGASLRLVLDQVELNVPIDPKAFTVTVPSSAVPITLAELKQAGPLGERSR